MNALLLIAGLTAAAMPRAKAAVLQPPASAAQAAKLPHLAPPPGLEAGPIPIQLPEHDKLPAPMIESASLAIEPGKMAAVFDGAKAVTSLSGLFVGDFAGRMRTWRPAQEEAVRRYAEAPKDKPFVVYVDGAVASGKTTFSFNLEERFRAAGVEEVMTVDEDAYTLPAMAGGLDLDSMRSDIASRRPKVLIVSLSGESARADFAGKRPDLYYYMRTSMLSRYWNSFSRLFKHYKGDDLVAELTFFPVIGAMMWATDVAMDALRFVARNVKPDYRRPDYFVVNSFTRRLLPSGRPFSSTRKEE